MLLSYSNKQSKSNKSRASIIRLYRMYTLLTCIELFVYAGTIAAAFIINLPKARVAVGHLDANHTVTETLFSVNFTKRWNLRYNDGVNDYQWKLYVRHFSSLLRVNLALALVILVARHLYIHICERGELGARKSRSTRIIRWLSLSCEIVCRLSYAASFIKCLQHFGRTRIIFFSHAMAGAVFVAVMHGPLVVFPLAFVLAYYLCVVALVRHLPYAAYITFVWFSTSLMHLCGVYYNGYSSITQLCGVHTCSSTTSTLQLLLHSLSTERLAWHSVFGMVTLRLISFSYDYWEAVHMSAQSCSSALHRHDTKCLECAQLRENAHTNFGRSLGGSQKANNRRTGINDNTPSSTATLDKLACGETISTLKHLHSSLRCYKFRTQCPHGIEEYRFVNYLAYIFFVPLYFTGPIISYNAFVSYIHVPSAAMPVKRLLLYTLGILFIFCVDYHMLCCYYAITYSQDANLFSSLSVSMRAGVLYLALAHLWCKFTVIWRVGTVFAAWCGVDTPEDMPSFFSSVSTIQNFWRGWHASFNIWIVRYMYIPLGGNKYKFFTIIPIFLYIAVWHDNEMRLVLWALTMCVTIALEVLIIQFFDYITRNVHLEMQRQRTNTFVSHGTSHSPLPQACASHRLLSASCFLPLRFFRRSLVCKAGQILELIVRECILPLSPTMRDFWHNVLCNIAHSAAAVGLILSNVVGFVAQSAQSTSSTQSSSVQSLHSIVAVLKEAGIVLVLEIMWLIFCASALTAHIRAIQRKRTQKLIHSLGIY